MSPWIEGLAWPYKLKPQLYNFLCDFFKAKVCLWPHSISSTPDSIFVGSIF